jgi:hypothetical protein
MRIEAPRNGVFGNFELNRHSQQISRRIGRFHLLKVDAMKPLSSE